MAHDLADSLRETIRQYKAAIASMEETLRKVAGVDAKVPAGAIREGQLIRRPNAWNVADDIERILERGHKSMPVDELIKTLVDGELVKGASRTIKVSAARRAITMGTLKGYLRIKGDTVHWVAGAYKNPRLRKII